MNDFNKQLNGSFLSNPKLDDFLLQSPGLCEQLFLANRTAFLACHFTEIFYKIAARSENLELRRTIARNDFLPLEILEYLSQDVDDYIRSSIATHKLVSLSILKRLLFDPKIAVRVDVVFNSQTPKWEIFKLLFRREENRSSSDELTFNFAILSRLFFGKSFFEKNIYKLLILQNQILGGDKKKEIHPCSQCYYFSGNSFLWCSVNPYSANKMKICSHYLPQVQH